jgi:hypothetical protein
MVGHTKKELQTSTFGSLPGKRKHVPQVHPDTGLPRVPLPHEGVQHRSHPVQPEEVNNTGHFLDKPPKPKLEHTINAHSAMHHVDRNTGGHVQGITSTQVAMSLAQAPLLEGNPLLKPPMGKHFETPKPAQPQANYVGSSPVKSHEGLHELGRAILREAVSSGGRIPQRVKSR